MKSVFVTGGAKGIGRAIAIRFAQNGYRVGISYCHSDTAASELEKKYGMITIKSDLSLSDGAKELSERILSDFGDVDVLINNAGVASYGLFQDVSPEEYDRVFNVNFKSAYFLTKALVGGMIQKKQGTVINISSIWGQTGGACEVVYSASKAALIGFTKALAKELGPSGITVNCIAPGVVDTDMMSSFTEDEKKCIVEEIPLGRFACPEEVAALALTLCEDGARFVTGQVIGVNGGMYC